MIWAVLITIAVTGMLLRKHEGGSLTEEPFVTAIYLVWPLALTVVVVMSLRDGWKEHGRRKEWEESRKIPEAKAIPKDLN